MRIGPLEPAHRARDGLLHREVKRRERVVGPHGDAGRREDADQMAGTTSIG